MIINTINNLLRYKSLSKLHFLFKENKNPAFYNAAVTAVNRPADLYHFF